METHSTPLTQHHISRIHGEHHPTQSEQHKKDALFIRFFILAPLLIAGIGVLFIVFTATPQVKQMTDTRTPMPTTVITPTAVATVSSEVSKVSSNIVTTEVVPVSTLSAQEIQDWKVFLNKKFNYSIKLPPFFAPDSNNSDDRTQRMYFSTTNNPAQQISMSLGFELYTENNPANLSCTTNEECYQALYKTVTFLKEEETTTVTAFTQGQYIKGIQIENKSTDTSTPPSVEYYFPFLVQGKYFDFRFYLNGYDVTQARSFLPTINTIVQSLSFENAQ